MKADGGVFGALNYINSVPAPMKIFSIAYYMLFTTRW